MLFVAIKKFDELTNRYKLLGNKLNFELSDFVLTRQTSEYSET